jgi:hypothetical protein
VRKKNKPKGARVFPPKPLGIKKKPARAIRLFGPIMLPVSPEQLRPFPEPEMLPDSGGMSLFGLIWLPVLATVIALLMLWAWQHRRNNPTQAAILTLLRLRSGLEREITATESGTDNTFAKLPAELTISSALDELVHTVRQWRACVLQEQPPSSSASRKMKPPTTASRQAAAALFGQLRTANGRRTDAGSPVTKEERWLSHLKRLEALLAELEHWRFSGRPMPARLALQYFDDTAGLLTEFLCPGKQER